MYSSFLDHRNKFIFWEISARHRGHCWSGSPHFTHTQTWPQGKNTCCRGASRHTQHSFSSPSIEGNKWLGLTDSATPVVESALMDTGFSKIGFMNVIKPTNSVDRIYSCIQFISLKHTLPLICTQKWQQSLTCVRQLNGSLHVTHQVMERQ